jgi:hypothetical protein
MSADTIVDFPCGSWVKLRTRHRQEIEGEVIAYDKTQEILLLKYKVDQDDDIETRACNVHLVNMAHVEEVSEMEEKTKNTGWAGPDFMSQRLNTAKLERRRIKNIEEKDNQAYAAKADIDPIGLELFNMIRKQLPDGLRWSGKDIEIGEVKITPSYAETNCSGGDERALQHIKKLVRRFHEKRV